MNITIQAVELTRNFGTQNAVENLNLEVKEGEVLGFLGPNGSGKTTTIRMLAGMIKPSRGYALVKGIRADLKVEQLHQVIGLLTESPGFYERLSARENLLYFARFYDIDSAAQVKKYLKIMGLWEKKDQKVGTFSKGMKHRLALARALVHEPEVLFLDEPTSGLDPEGAKEVRELIKKLEESGKTIFLSTHNLEEAELLCNRIALIKTRLLLADTAENLRKRLFQNEVVVEMDDINIKSLNALKKLSFVQGVEHAGNKITINMDNSRKNRSELINCIVRSGGKILSVYEKKHTLEDIYLTLIREEKDITGKTSS